MRRCIFFPDTAKYVEWVGGDTAGAVIFFKPAARPPQAAAYSGPASDYIGHPVRQACGRAFCPPLKNGYVVFQCVGPIFRSHLHTDFGMQLQLRVFFSVLSPSKILLFFKFSAQKCHKCTAFMAY